MISLDGNNKIHHNPWNGYWTLFGKKCTVFCHFLIFSNRHKSLINKEIVAICLTCQFLPSRHQAVVFPRKNRAFSTSMHL